MNFKEYKEFAFKENGWALILKYNCDFALRAIFDPYCAEYMGLDHEMRVNFLISVYEEGISLSDLLEAYEEGISMMNDGRGRPDILMYLPTALNKLLDHMANPPLPQKPRTDDEKEALEDIKSEAKALVLLGM